MAADEDEAFSPLDLSGEKILSLREAEGPVMDGRLDLEKSGTCKISSLSENSP
jgi:hypothetical protein